MIDTDWLLRTMMGDNLVVRLYEKRMSGGRSDVLGKAFTYWLEDSLYVYSEVTYRKKAHEERFLPLEIKTSDRPSDNWLERIAKQAERWPTGWRLSEPIVCIRGHEHVAPSNPDALVHLARFEGMATEAAGKAAVYDTISYRIVARRLGGIVNGATNNWSQLFYQNR